MKHATRAKRVDVRELKHQIWEDISTLDATNPKGSDGDEEEKNDGKEENDAAEMAAGAGGKKALLGGAADHKSFADVMTKCAAGQSQSGVTLPFYFICVLHLANEHGLKLEGNDELSDFTIAMDAC